jgi:hypothetical protein
VNTKNTNNDITQELNAIEEDLRELEEDFGDLGLEGDDEGNAGDAEESSSELAELESAIEGTDFERPLAESSMLREPSVLDIADEQGGDQEGWISDAAGAVKSGVGGIVGGAKRVIKSQIKRKASKIINRIVRLVKKYRKLAACAPAVTKAVLAYKLGQYGTALKLGYSAYKCIRKHT